MSVPAGLASESALQKKRQFAEERAERLRDPRQRCLGIDKSALDEQVREKQMLAAAEKERDKFFATQTLTLDKHASLLQQEADRLRIERERDVVKFRDTFQKRQMTREWDLNDPDRLVKDAPARVSDVDERCGPSSLQKFEGEDLDGRLRASAQHAQARSWAEQQVDEKNMKKWMEREAARQYEDRAEDMAHRTYQVERTIAEQRRQMAISSAEFNRALAEQKRKEKLAERERTTRRNLAEIETLINSDLLCESPVTTHGADFKGMPSIKRQAILSEQESQRQQRAQARLEEAEAERQRDTRDAMNARMATLLDRQRERERREASKQMGEERIRQAQEASEKKKALDKLYANAISEEYFVYGKCM